LPEKKKNEEKSNNNSGSETNKKWLSGEESFPLKEGAV
jgi:hypothetical protein